jgi:hypothetical protein
MDTDGAAREAQVEKLRQLRALNAFLDRITTLDEEGRYQEYYATWKRLFAQQQIAITKARQGDEVDDLIRQILGLVQHAPPYEDFDRDRTLISQRSAAKLDFLQAFAVCMQKDLRAPAYDRLNRAECPANSQRYNTELIRRIDDYCKELHAYVDLMRIDSAEDEPEDVNVKKLTSRGHQRMPESFLQVILFVFAVSPHVQQSLYEQTFQLRRQDVDMDITWMNDDCKYYQDNRAFMHCLLDCAKIALLAGHYNIPPRVRAVCDTYKSAEGDYSKAAAFEAHMETDPRLPLEMVHAVTNTVRSTAHGNTGRPSTAPARTRTARALLELHALLTEL